MDEVVLDDRHLRFAEELDDPEAAVDRKRRSALAGEVAGLERLVRIEDQLLLAIFGADVDADAVLRPRELDAIFAERAGEVGVATCSDVRPWMTPNTLR